MARGKVCPVAVGSLCPSFSQPHNTEHGSWKDRKDRQTDRWRGGGREAAGLTVRRGIQTDRQTDRKRETRQRGCFDSRLRLPRPEVDDLTLCSSQGGHLVPGGRRGGDPLQPPEADQRAPGEVGLDSNVTLSSLITFSFLCIKRVL